MMDKSRIPIAISTAVYKWRQLQWGLWCFTSQKSDLFYAAKKLRNFWQWLREIIKPWRHTTEMHASIIVAFGLVMTSTFWPLTLKTFSATPNHMVNICAKFNWNPSTKYGDIASHEIGVTRQWLDGQRPGRTTEGQTENLETYCLLCRSSMAKARTAHHHQQHITTGHSFPRPVEYWAELRNLLICHRNEPSRRI